MSAARQSPRSRWTRTCVKTPGQKHVKGRSGLRLAAPVGRSIIEVLNGDVRLKNKKIKIIKHSPKRLRDMNSLVAGSSSRTRAGLASLSTACCRVPIVTGLTALAPRPGRVVETLL